MTDMTNYLEPKLVDHTLGLTAFALPPAAFLGLHTGSPTDTGSLANEILTSGTGYARQSLAAKMSSANVVTGISVNTGVITHGPATTDWGTLTYGSEHDAVTAGNMHLYAALGESQTTPIGESFQLTSGQYSVQFS